MNGKKRGNPFQRLLLRPVHTPCKISVTMPYRTGSGKPAFARRQDRAGTVRCYAGSSGMFLARCHACTASSR